MIKKLLLTVALTSVSLLSYGQGSVWFQTDNGANSAFGPRAYSDTGLTTKAFGSGYYLQLWAADGAGAAEGTLTPRSALVNIRGSSATSITAGCAMITGTPLGSGVNVPVNNAVTVTALGSGQVTLQIRGWSSAYATYAAAETANAAIGKTTTFNYTPVFAPTGVTLALGGLYPGATGYPGGGVADFAITVAVPEPSTIALGVMGLGALMIRRRK